MPKQRFCPSCRQLKNETTENFQRKGEGYRNPCKTCLSTRKSIERSMDWTKAGFVKKPIVNKPIPIVNNIVNKEKVKIDPLYCDFDIFKSLSDKYQCHYVISVQKNGRCILGIHAKPAQLTFKGNSVEECMNAALN